MTRDGGGPSCVHDAWADATLFAARHVGLRHSHKPGI